MAQTHPCGNTHKCIFRYKCTHTYMMYIIFLKKLKFKQFKTKKAHKHSHATYYISMGCSMKDRTNSCCVPLSQIKPSK